MTIRRLQWRRIGGVGMPWRKAGEIAESEAAPYGGLFAGVKAAAIEAGYFGGRQRASAENGCGVACIRIGGWLYRERSGWLTVGAHQHLAGRCLAVLAGYNKYRRYHARLSYRILYGGRRMAAGLLKSNNRLRRISAYRCEIIGGVKADGVWRTRARRRSSAAAAANGGVKSASKTHHIEERNGGGAPAAAASKAHQ